eukprot:6484342-Amphidinium_carterae.2
MLQEKTQHVIAVQKSAATRATASTLGAHMEQRSDQHRPPVLHTENPQLHSQREGAIHQPTQ